MAHCPDFSLPSGPDPGSPGRYPKSSDRPETGRHQEETVLVCSDRSFVPSFPLGTGKQYPAFSDYFPSMWSDLSFYPQLLEEKIQIFQELAAKSFVRQTAGY